ncbi:MAG: hypothetical protein KA751_07310 [Comamonas sp.]|nr:hypothetical protein [Comamonas sp.]
MSNFDLLRAYSQSLAAFGFTVEKNLIHASSSRVAKLRFLAKTLAKNTAN